MPRSLTYVGADVLVVAEGESLEAARDAGRWIGTRDPVEVRQ